MWNLRLTPYVWRLSQALAYGAVAGALCAIPLWLVGWLSGEQAAESWTVPLPALPLVAIVGALMAACAALLRNEATRWFYRPQKLERLASARWAPWELAVSGAIVFSVAAMLAVTLGAEANGVALGGLHQLVLVLLAACIGALFLKLVGFLRRFWMARRER